MKKYSIGLDIGTTSVGYACIDEDNNFLTYKGRAAYGVRLFESAQSAADRRSYRSARRMQRRRRRRIQLLQELFYNQINNIDKSFFQSLDRNISWNPDKKDNWFVNMSYTDVLRESGTKEQIDKYKTIYHIRKDLVESEEKFDLRLIYIALHSLIKRRGHFLLDLDISKLSDGTSIEELREKFLEVIENIDGFNLDGNTIDDYIDILRDKSTRNQSKLVEIKEIFGKDDQILEFSKLLLGYKVKDVKKIFKNLTHDKAIPMHFKDIDTLDNENLTDEVSASLERIYLIYVLMNLDYDYLCTKKVEEYEQFEEDLKYIKKILKEENNEGRCRLFVSSKEALKLYKEKCDNKLLCSFDKYLNNKDETEKFYKELKKELCLCKSLDEEFRNRLEANSVLIKLRNTDNTSIPNQIVQKEISKILENQSLHYDFIDSKFIEDVLNIVKFKIPYYVGPLINSGNDSEFGFLSRNVKNQRISPNNFNNVVDKASTAERFIRKMTNKCTYLYLADAYTNHATGEEITLDNDVLPNSSLLFQEYKVHSELNMCYLKNIKDSKKRKYLTTEQKNSIIENIYLKSNTIKVKKVYEHLIGKFNIDSSVYTSLEGISDKDKFNNNLSSFRDLVKFDVVSSCDFFTLSKREYQRLESIILTLTIFRDKELIESKLSSFGCTNEQILRLKNKSYSGFGRLSRGLLDQILSKYDNTIIETLRYGSDVYKRPHNLSSVINDDKLGFNQIINELNTTVNNEKSEITPEDINELYGSPALKRGIWQAIKIVDELECIFEADYGKPAFIALEMAKEEGQKFKTTTSRNKKVQDVIKNNDKLTQNILKQHYNSNNKYHNEKEYLYMLQGGKCLYSQETLDYSQLHNYEIDHIYPRSYVKDDSLDNKALVLHKYNQDKLDTSMPLEVITRFNINKNGMISYWEHLLKINAISQTKYYRLIKESFNELDKDRFTKRALVETRQILKNTKNLLFKKYQNSDTEILNINSFFVDQIRKEFDIVKLRDLNDYHHAVDAFIVALVANFASKNKNFMSIFSDNDVHKNWRALYSKGDNQYKKKIQNVILYRMKEEFADNDKNFDLGKFIVNKIDNTKAIVSKKIMYKDTAALWKITPISPKSKKNNETEYFSEKSDTYVYTNLYNYCTLLLKDDTKKKTTYKLLDVRNHLMIKYDYDVKKLINSGDLKLDSRYTILRVLYKNQYVQFNNHSFYFKSSNEFNNSRQFYMTVAEQRKLQNVLNSDEINKKEYDELIELLVIKLSKYYSTVLKYKNENDIRDNLLSKISKLNNDSEYKSVINGLLKITKTGGSRWEDSPIGKGRHTSSKGFENGKIIHYSCTGLIQRKENII